MTARVNVNGSLSEPVSVYNGVKQGDITAPTLFSIYFAVMLEHAFKDCDIGIYIRFRTSGKVFNLRRFNSKSKTFQIIVRELLPGFYNRKQHQVGRQNNIQSRGGGKIEQEQPLPRDGGTSSLSTKLKIEQSSSHGEKYFPGIGYSKSPISRTTSTFSKVLGKNDKGSKHTGYNKGLSDTIQVKSSSTQKLERDPIEQKSKGTNRYGNIRKVEEGSNTNLSSFANSVSKQILLSSQEGRGSPASHKLEIIKQQHTLPALQNGGLALSKVHVATERLHVQARHEGRLFLSPPKQNLKGNSSFSVVREAIRVPLPLFRPESCTKDLYKNLRGSHVAFKAIEHSDNHISGRHVITGRKTWRRS